MNNIQTYDEGFLQVNRINVSNVNVYVRYSELFQRFQTLIYLQTAS